MHIRTFASSFPISLIANLQQGDNKEYFEMQALYNCKVDFFFLQGLEEVRFKKSGSL